MTTNKGNLFLSSHVEIVKIGEDDYSFRPFRVKALVLAKDIIKSLTASAASLMDPSDGNYVETEYIQDAEGGSKTTTKPISTELLDHRERRQEQQWDRAIDGLLGVENLLGVATLVLDSMRLEDVTPQDMIEEIDIGRLGELVKAMFKANVKVFGKLPGKVQAAVDGISTRLGGKVANAESPASETPEKN